MMNKSLKILVGEDEYLCLMGIKSNLKRLGHEVIGEAANGKDAVKLALDKKPDLLIMDINMDSLDGIEAIKRINQKLFIPCIILTGYTDDDLIQRSKEVGVFGYLVKPVDANDLKGAIEIAMARFHEFKELRNELESIEKALEARKYIERAKGILMDRHGLKEAEAMKKLQKMSCDRNKKLLDLAREIIKADALLNE